MSLVEEKKVIRIAVNPKAKTVIETVADALDMTEVGLASRVYEWFGQQPDAIQKAVLGLFPAGYEPDIAKLILDRMAGDGMKYGKPMRFAGREKPKD